MDRAAYFESVHDALIHLYDFAHLTKHTLGMTLGGSTSLTPIALHQVLLRTIEQLRPPAGTPATTVAWRQHRYLERRYVDGMSHELVARELELSLRQAHRVRLSAMDAVATSLWEKHRPAEELVGASEPGSAPSQRISADAPSERPTGHSLLDVELARLAGRAVETPSTLADELAAALSLVSPLANRGGVLIDVEEPLPTVALAVERGLLRQILILLFGHAIEWQGTGRLFVACDVSADVVTCDVVYLFRSGQSLSTDNRQDQRLETAHRLAEALRGALGVLSVDGGGTCLRLTVPRDRTLTVLVVDDNPDLAHLFSAYLKGSPYRVVHAKTARAAIRVVGQTRPDVITLDVMMPFQDGWDVFRQLKANPETATTPIIVCSILPERDVALAMGATEFLAKPVDHEDLLTALQRCRPLDSRAHRDPIAGNL